MRILTTAALLFGMLATEAHAQIEYFELLTAKRDTALGPDEYAATDGLLRIYGIHALGFSASDYFVEDVNRPLTGIHNTQEGTVHIQGTVHDREDPSLLVTFDLHLMNERQALCWDEEDPNHSILLNDDPLQEGYQQCPNTSDSMSVFVVDPASRFFLHGGWSGYLALEHMPVSQNKRWQLGEGGNNHNCFFGLSGWYKWDGEVNGEPAFGLSGDVIADVVNRTDYAVGQTLSAQCDLDALVLGCTDATACNYNAAAELDDGTCYPCDIPAVHCGFGTTWDEASATCVADPSADTNGDGCVQLNDLLAVLGAYGTCGPFTCGNPVNYQGYFYATVQIGEQCWFAENLRNEAYANGDAIPSNLSDSEWSSTTSGAVAVYGEGSSTCLDDYSEGDACNEAWSLNEYGRLYNWYAVDDARALCPSGWHVPTDGEWMTLEMALGMSEEEANTIGWRGSDEGSQLKSQAGWFNLGNGSNLAGFKGNPSGHRLISGYFTQSGTDERWWTSSGTGAAAWHHDVTSNRTDIERDLDESRYGLSVRCVQDAD